MSELSWFEWLKFNFSAEASDPKLSLADFRVNIQFLSWPIIRYQRDVLFGWVDLLVSFGGIAGLFLGFSLLSLLEIFYYFTLRAGCMFVKNNVRGKISQSWHLPLKKISSFQEKLLKLQEEIDNRPQQHYDLSLLPKFSKSQSLQPKDIRIVKPQNWVNSSIDYQKFEGISRSNKTVKRKVVKSRFESRNMMVRTLKEILFMRKLLLHCFQRRKYHRPNTFLPPSYSPYSDQIIPLDKLFSKKNKSDASVNTVYYGYLPWIFSTLKNLTTNFRHASHKQTIDETNVTIV